MIEEKLLDLIHKTKPKRFFSFFFPLCCGHGKLISNFHFNCFVHEKPFLQFLLVASINVSTELLARKNDLNVAQQRNRINYWRIGFVWLELVKVSFSRASARRRHKSIENWIMFPRSGKSKVTGDEVRVTSLWATEFSRQCYAILLSRNSAESAEQFSVFRHQRNGTVHGVWVCGWEYAIWKHNGNASSSAVPGNLNGFAINFRPQAANNPREVAKNARERKFSKFFSTTID